MEDDDNGLLFPVFRQGDVFRFKQCAIELQLKDLFVQDNIHFIRRVKQLFLSATIYKYFH